MPVDTGMSADAEKRVASHGEAPVVGSGSGNKDLIVGFAILGAMAFVAVALGIILSLT
jgi:hypothetical protein